MSAMLSLGYQSLSMNELTADQQGNVTAESYEMRIDNKSIQISGAPNRTTRK
jgi:hypothetical protein